MNDSRDLKILYLFGIIPCIWLGLIISPYINGGLVEIVKGFSISMENPFMLSFNENSIKTILILIGIYLLCIAVYDSSKRNYRINEEHGSAKWGNVYSLNKKYSDNPKEGNKIMTQNIRIGLNTKKHKRNLNTIVVGGSGSGKTLFYVVPNLLQANSSYFVLDPKGEILRMTGTYLESKGYEIKVLDLVHPNLSHCYNPFNYLNTNRDVARLVENLFTSLNEGDNKSTDPFWDEAAKMFLMSLVYLIRDEAPEYERNPGLIPELIRAGAINGDDENYESALEILINRLALINPNHPAVIYYKNYRIAASKTMKSVAITLASKLKDFNDEDIIKLTMTDELDLKSLGRKKVAIYAIISDADSSMDFLMTTLYTQMFQVLYDLADYEYGGRLPVPVEFIMDEFANVSIPKDFERKVATMRSRGISVSIILQGLSQISKKYEKIWEIITGNCDEFLYLGGNEQYTHEYISKIIGKETIDTLSDSKSSGSRGGFSTNHQVQGRELMQASEVRLLDNKKAIFLLKGERPVMDFKFNIFKSKDLDKTSLGKGKEYIHGKVNKDKGIITLNYEGQTFEKQETKINMEDTGFELVSSEELEKIYKED
ncbi:MAG: type IV secretory system conjugative DNA transfer family protein [Clostridia bacterium]|nr:type IV secretory system conjugative DNA transfer family protein [Clostridia bacterium]